MKTLKIALTLFLAAFFYTNADAQILRNSFLIGGSMNFDYSSGKTTVTNPRPGQRSTVNEPTSTLFGIEPRFGYFVADNFCIGLNLDFRLNSQTSEYPVNSNDPNSELRSLTTTTTRLITGPFARYYGALSDNVYAFGEVSFGGGLDSRIVSDTANNLPQSVSVSNLQFGVGPGLNFFLNDYVAFEALAKYTYSQSTFTAFNQKNQTVGSNIRFTVGLQVYFRAVTAGIKE